MSSIFIPPFPVSPGLTSESIPRFSIITATYNSSALFERTSKSIRGQRFRDFEWIVVDGASKDNTVSRIKAQGDLVTRWISEKDRGISDAWNKGLALSKGEYILLLNAGDTYDPEFLEQLNAHADGGTRVICSHARLHTETGQKIGVIRSEPEKLYRAMHLAHNWCAVPRIHYETLGGYVEMKLAMDFEWFHRYFRYYGMNGFIVIDAPLGAYHLGGTSDVNFAASFRANTDILIHHGMRSSTATFWRLAYTAKHAWRVWQARRLQKFR